MYVRLREVRQNNELKSRTNSLPSEAAHRMRRTSAPERRLFAGHSCKLVRVSASADSLSLLLNMSPHVSSCMDYESRVLRRDALRSAAIRRTFGVSES